MRSLRFRILLLFVALLVAVQAITLFTIYGSMRQQVANNIANQLDVGRRVFLTQFNSRRQSLAVYSHVMGRDFGLLQTFHDDPKSLLVALNNHRRRVDADLAIAVDEQGLIRADTESPDATGEDFGLFDVSDEARRNAGMFLSVNGKTYQVVAAPLLAPNPIGRVYLGFVVDDALAREFQALTSLQVTFLAATADRGWHVIASTLPDPMRAELAQRYMGSPDTSGQHAEHLGDETWLTLPLLLADEPGTPVLALLQRSRDAALAYYKPWWREVVEVFLAALALALIAAWATASNAMRPVRLLVEQARAIGRGNYAEPIATRQGGELGELVEEFNHMQQAIAERETSIRHHAYHDGLTGLVNRYRLEQLAAERICEAERADRRLGVLIIDLNRFKDINDTLGHQAGDRLLREVGARIAAAVQPDDVVARLGGDEFGVLIDDLAVADIHSRLDALGQAVMRPYTLEGLTLNISIGIGVAIYPDHGHDAEALLQHADIAHFAAKEKHLRYALYDGAQDRYSLLRLSLLGELQAAMERGDLVLHYQPKFELARNEVTAAEALIRWQHPVYGLITPDEFIPMAEHTGNIHVLTAWVIRTALRQTVAWRDQGLAIRVAVNVSAHDLRRAEFVADIRAALADCRATPEMLSIEITESAVMADVEQAVSALDQLNDLGIECAVDDYGTGYSSMAQLRRLPVQELKIDKSFVLNADRNADDELIVHSTIELGHNLRLRVTAEGVETGAALELLRRLGCDYAQGYYISRPLPAESFEQWLQARAWIRGIAGSES